MPQPIPIDPRASLRALLAYELRRQREARGLSQEQLAGELHTTRATIQAYESQRNRPDEEFCRALDAFFGTGELFHSLWWHSRRQHLREWLTAYVDHEQEATQIRTFQPFYIPGLLQTEGYVRAGMVIEDVPEERVTRRLARRDILTRKDDPPFLWAVVDEGVLMRPVGGARVMKEQLQHLLDMGELPNVTVQVVRMGTGWYVGFNGAIMILTKRDGAPVGYVEAQFGGRLIEDCDEVTRLGVCYDLIRAKALSEDASRALIKKAMETMRDDPVAEEQPQSTA